MNTAEIKQFDAVEAIKLGFAAELIAIEDEFESLRGLPKFEELVGGRSNSGSSAGIDQARTTYVA